MLRKIIDYTVKEKVEMLRIPSGTLERWNV